MKPIIAMDIGGTNMRIALIDERFRILKVMRFPTLVGDKAAFMNQVAATIEALGSDMKDVSAISIGVPGQVDASGHIKTLPNIHIDDVALAPFLEERFHKPVHIRNDAEMAALCEAKLGAGKRHKRTYFVTISTGVGGALVVNHALVNSSYEIGHTLFPYKGKFYEFERIASGSGLIALCAMNGLEIQATSLFFSLVNSGNPQALAIFEDWLDLMATFLNRVQNLFEPDIIALTGGVMKSRDVFFEKLARKVHRVPVVPAEFGDDAGLMGAASLVLFAATVTTKTKLGDAL
ncbi:MAG: ROK family protein [Bacilli bacterium]